MELVRKDFLSGDIYKLDVKDIDSFFEDKYPSKISEAGVEAFLKALKIPVKYFLKQPYDTKIELLQNQKDSVSAGKSLILLVRKDIVEYVSLGDDLFVSDSAEITPINDSWIFLEEDLTSGYIRFFMSTEDLKEEDYNLGIFIDYPILFAKPMIINTGFYKINQEDTSLNIELIVPGTKIKLKNTELPNTEHNSYFVDLIEDIKNNNFEDCLKFLESNKTDSDTCVNLLLNFEKDKLIVRSISKKVRKYIEKENLTVDSLLDLSSVMSSFINYLKSYSSKLKYKTDILNSLLIKHNKKFNLDYLENFKEGY